MCFQHSTYSLQTSLYKGTKSFEGVHATKALAVAKCMTDLVGQPGQSCSNTIQRIPVSSETIHLGKDISSFSKPPNDAAS